MPKVRVRDIDLFYLEAGEGEPLVLIMGFGGDHLGWGFQVPAFAERYRVIVFDNRGAGQTDVPEAPWTIRTMADDTVGLLDVLGIERAHVCGVSMGGMIAQEIALRHPDRVRALVLGCTTPGGERAVPAAPETLAFFQRRGEMPAEEAVWASVPYNYGPATRRDHGERIAQDIVQRLRFPIEPEPYRAQLAAALGHDAHDRLAQIGVPTLVVHGAEDVMVMPANGRLLAEAIPGAELIEAPGAGHLYVTDAPELDRAVGAFLTARSTPGPSAPAPR